MIDSMSELELGKPDVISPHAYCLPLTREFILRQKMLSPVTVAQSSTFYNNNSNNNNY
jgi:hypothetical protein